MGGRRGASKALEVVESILLTTPCEALTADYLTELIHDRLSEQSIDLSRCISTSFDGAANFSGARGGVQQLLRSRYAPISCFVHCLAHRANLVLNAVCLEVQSMIDCLSHCCLIHCKRPICLLLALQYTPQWIRIQKMVYPDERPRELRALSETRWNARFESVNIMWLRLKAIYELLDYVIEHDIPDRRAKAEALSNRLNGVFIVGLSMMRWILKVMSAFTIEMQKIDFNLSDAIGRAKDLHSQLLRPGTDEPDEIWSDVIFGPAKTLCEELEIDFIPQRPVRRVRQERRVQSEADYRDIFVQVCSALRQEIYARFLGEERQALYDGLDALNPAMGDKFLNIEPIVCMAKRFNLVGNDSTAVTGLIAELRTLKDTLARLGSRPGNLMALLEFLNERESIFHYIFNLVKICATIPVSSAQCERGFSGVRRVKNFIRSTMTHDRLSDLIVLHLNRELASKINEEETVDNYRDAAERRIKL